MASERWVFPLDCPDCKSASGYPYEATTIQGNRTAVRIGLRCRDCRHEWLLQLETDALSDPDRASQRGQE
jgi:hypothetical protein